jgi:hypothetical protein
MGYTLWQVPRAAAQHAAANDSAAVTALTAPPINNGAPESRVRISLAEAFPAEGSGQHRLLSAVLKSAHIALQDVELVTDGMEVALALPSLVSLQQDAAMRRALWPTLRRLRRTRR